MHFALTIRYLCRAITVTTLASATLPFAGAAFAQQGFPFGSEFTLDAAPMRGSKRIPNLEIGEAGEVRLELWCKAADGQFSVAGDTIIFIPGAVEDRNCPADRAQADDALMAALADVASWRQQGDTLTLTGSRTLRFRMLTN